MLLSLGLSITVFFLTSLLTFGWIKVAQKRKILDQPERRRLHQSFVPRAGGISIAGVMIVVIVAIVNDVGVQGYWPIIMTGTVLYAALGLWDDLTPMPAPKKLFLHLLACLMIFFVAVLFSRTGFVAAFMIAVAYLLCVNIWNFMDGSNGMIGAQTLCMTIGLLALGAYSSAVSHYALALAACCLGFLPFNFPVARVFLGDVGSHVLGAALLGLALLAYIENQWSLLEIVCLGSALYIDAVLTFIRRFLRNSKVTQAHRSHLYQYAIRSGKTHVEVCWYYVAWTACMILALGLGRKLSADSQRILLLTLLVLGCALHQWLRLFVLKSRYRPRMSKSK
jgi:UDP-N-acetylmuramyl pentapeptide phosphotransferase/UDP-N-acetylglucosamine-1-phosphate transferase